MCNQSECLKVLTDNKSYLQNENEVTGMRLFGSTALGDKRSDSDVGIQIKKDAITIF